MLFVVPVPIGNLGDITKRSLDILYKSPYIICEDSRLTRKLLALLDIYNGQKFVDITKNQQLNFTAIQKTLELSKTENVCLVSDAGTPGISDPGMQIIKMAIENNLSYDILPGANSVFPGLLASGFLFKDFYFAGFLPTKKGRQKELKRLSEFQTVIVLFESKHRLEKLFIELGQYFSPDKNLFIAKELTKTYQEYIHTKILEIPKLDFNQKGEYVIVIDNR